MKLSLAQEKAARVYEYMKRGTAGLIRETANEVDHDPASWGMDIDDWDWNAGVGMTAISDYYEKTQNPEILHYMANWIARNKHQCAKKDHVNYLTPLAIYPDMYLKNQGAVLSGNGGRVRGLGNGKCREIQGWCILSRRVCFR